MAMAQEAEEGGQDVVEEGDHLDQVDEVRPGSTWLDNHRSVKSGITWNIKTGNEKHEKVTSRQNPCCCETCPASRLSGPTAHSESNPPENLRIYL